IFSRNWSSDVCSSDLCRVYTWSFTANPSLRKCPILKNRDDIRTCFKIASPFLKLKKLGLTDRPEAIISGQSTPPNMVELVCPRRTRARLLVGKNFSNVVGKVMGDGVGSTNDGLVIK